MHRASWDGKLLGKDYRLTWNYHTWKLEELPQKGKKQLGISTMQTMLGFGGVNTSPFIQENVLRDAKITENDSYEHVKEKLQKAMDLAAKKIQEENPDQKLDWMKSTWSENKVHYLKVTPEGTEPFEAKGKDFSVSVSWTTFKSYSPNSDLQQMDPSYTMYESTSPASARKLYQTLKANPKALEHLTWDQFGDWMTKNKIHYDTRHSVWH